MLQSHLRFLGGAGTHGRGPRSRLLDDGGALLGGPQQQLHLCLPGGAGTTGAGLAAGCPTMAVPFFGDQAFWGEMCRRSGVGPAPVPVERLTVEALLEGLGFLARPEVRP